MIFTTFLVILFCSVTTSGSARFEKVLNLYDNHSFYAADRHLFIDARYYKQWPEISVDSVLDTASFETYGFFTDLGFRKQDYREKQNNIYRRYFAADLRYSYGNSSYWFGGYLQSDSMAQQFDQKDTVSHFFKLDMSYKKQLKEFTGINRGFLSPFFKLDMRLAGTFYYKKEENFEPPFPEPPEGAYISRNAAAEGYAEISPGIGTGRQKNVSYIYYAAILEKHLLKNGIIKFALSENSMKDIAVVLSKSDTHKLSDPANLKALKAKLDSIILSDVSGSKEMIRNLSPFWLKKMFFHTTAHFMSGPQLFLEAVQSIEPALNYKNVNYTYDPFSMHEDTLKSYSDFYYNTHISLRFKWGIPFTKYCFMYLTANKILLYKNMPDLFYYKGKLSAVNIAEIRWGMDVFFPLSHWAMIQAGFRDMPAHIVIPDNYPYHSFLTLNLYIEDYITFQCGLSFYHFKESSRRPYSNFLDNREGCFYHGYMPSMKLIYQF